MPSLTRRNFLASFSAAALPLGDWSEHGFSDDQRARLLRLMEQSVESRTIAGGALLLLHRGEIILRESFGVADIQTGEPFGTERICHLASLSKPIISTLLTALDEQGVLSLDDPVKKYLPSFASAKVDGRPVESDVLLWHCLSHRTGFPGNGENPDSSRDYLDWTAADYVTKKLDEGLRARPGSRYAYSRLGFMTALLVVEQATGRPFEEVLRQTLLDPLKMVETTFRPSAERISENASRYRRVDGDLKQEQTIPSDFGQRKLINPGGGLFSTLDEVAGFLQLHLDQGRLEGKRFVGAEALRRMRRPHPASPDERVPYGLGWNLQPRRIGQARHLGAGGTMGFIDVEGAWGGVLLTQTRWQGNNAFRQAFEKQVNSIFDG